MEKEPFNLYRPVKPTNKEIFYALASEEPADWCKETLENADPENVKKVREILFKGLTFGEAEIEIENLAEGGDFDESRK